MEQSLNITIFTEQELLSLHQRFGNLIEDFYLPQSYYSYGEPYCKNAEKGLMGWNHKTEAEIGNTLRSANMPIVRISKTGGLEVIEEKAPIIFKGQLIDCGLSMPTGVAIIDDKVKSVSPPMVGIRNLTTGGKKYIFDPMHKTTADPTLNPVVIEARDAVCLEDRAAQMIRTLLMAKAVK